MKEDQSRLILLEGLPGSGKSTNSNEFYIEDLPVILKVERNRIIIAGEQLINRWTTSGTEFMKV